MITDRDFIKRLIQQLANMLASALKLRNSGKNEEALEAIRSSSGDLLGMDWDVLKFGGVGSALQLLGSPEKVKTYARMVEEEAVTLLAMGESAEAVASFSFAMALYESVLAARASDEEAAAGRERCVAGLS